VLTHHLVRLRRELRSPRQSALRSTLGLAVPRAALSALESRIAGAVRPHAEAVEDGGAPDGRTTSAGTCPTPSGAGRSTSAPAVDRPAAAC
jgi:hypothetical protein